MRNILKAVPFFQDLTVEEIDRVLAVGRVVSYAKDMVLFKESDPGEALYIVLDGSVRISKLVPGLGEQIIAFVEQGSFFGEMALFDDFPRSATATAQQDCQILFIDRAVFVRLLQEHASIASKVLWAFCRTLSLRLREASDRIVALSAFNRPVL
ncbi:MAG TPA: cyclic nucleotide-binding domain-containing protein [Candidatus Sulfotelmatobacter sp.]|nr:cyclic nucleotide-binding domain-containing protein [Candidatus Sulfotelmatobacter sp.]